MYLSLYTWNLRTGWLDGLVTHTGLEFAGWVLKPGRWAETELSTFWDRYIHLVDVKEENEALQENLDRLVFELSQYKEQASEVTRLRRLLSFAPPEHWTSSGARVITHRLGPHASLNTLVVDKGYLTGASKNAPVITHIGVIGRIIRSGPFTSTVLLLNDPNSRIAVLGQSHRTAGILVGKGSEDDLRLLYVPLNAPLDEGEILTTSSLAGIFPKGLPVARIKRIEISDISLFQTVTAEPLVNIKDIEEVLLLERSLPPQNGNSTLTVDVP